MDALKDLPDQTSVEALPMSWRAKRCLRIPRSYRDKTILVMEPILSVGQLRAFEWREYTLLKIAGCGHKTLAEIRSVYERVR